MSLTRDFCDVIVPCGDGVDSAEDDAGYVVGFDGFFQKDNGRETLDLTASPLRGGRPLAPSTVAARNNHPPPMVIQGDFRKVSGISTEIFKQIETVENDHDASTAAALEHVERRGEMIVRILDSRQLSRTASETAKRFIAMQDAKYTVQFVEIVKRPGQTLGLYIREGNGIDRGDGVFISRIALESAVFNSGCLKVGDEILAVNLVDVTHMSLDDVVIIMSIPRRLLLATRQRKGGAKVMGGGGLSGTGGMGPGGQGSPSMQPRLAEHKPPPVVVLKRDLRDDDLMDDGGSIDGMVGGGMHTRDTLRQRHTGDGREMVESRSRLGLGLDTVGSGGRHGQLPDSNGLDLYYNSRPPQQDSWGGYQPPPPPVITEQPKPGMQQFHHQYDRYQHPGTLESLAEKVHAFGLPNPRRMSAGGQPIPTRLSSQQSPSSHYYIQHSGTGSRRIMPRSGSDQHLPHTEYADYTSITQAGRHSLLRSSLKSGSTLSRYNQRYIDQASQLAQSKYGTTGQYAASTLTRRNRSSLDYSSDTEATCGPRTSYYYYGNRNQPSVPHSTLSSIGRANPMASSDISTKFNSLPRDTRGAARLPMNKRFGDRTVASLLQDEADGNISAPEMPSIRQRDDYRQWLSRTPSTSAIYEQIRASRDVLNQQRAARFTYSAENIHAALKDTEGSYYGSTYASGRPGASSTLDRGFIRAQQLPARSLSTQHITSTTALASTRSPSIRRMRQLLDLDSVRTGAPSPVPQTPSSGGTLPRSGQRQLDINPAEFLKYKVDKPGGIGGPPQLGGLNLGGPHGMGIPTGEEPISGMLWIHLLAGRGLRASTGSSVATTPVTPSGGQPLISSGAPGLRDLYCVLECDRVHKARTVVRTGDLVFDWDESFELDLVYNRELDLLIYSWDPQFRHKLCYKGSVHLPSLLKSGPLHQLALKIEPRGTLYLRLRHTDTTTLYRRRGLSNLTLSRTTPLFGVDLESVVNREMKTGGVTGGVTTALVSTAQQVPIIIRRCIEEIERRGLDIIGLYRLCGSATKKRILREAFERNSRSVDLTPDNVPDINVITGVLKDYLRELPEPLFTKCLYQMMVDALGVCLPDDPEGNAKLMFSILDCLPRMNRATLIFLMDHLALVVSASDRNKMSAQNLATALAPPLMLHSAIDIHQAGYKTGDIDYTQPIGVLKYLLQIWPTPKHHTQGGRRAARAQAHGPQRGDSRSVCHPGVQPLGAVGSSVVPGLQLGPSSLAGLASSQASCREPSLRSAVPYPVHPRSVALGQRGPVPPVPSPPIQGQSSVSKGPYRPLSPRVAPPLVGSGGSLPSYQLASHHPLASSHPLPHPLPLVHPLPQSALCSTNTITSSSNSSISSVVQQHQQLVSPAASVTSVVSVASQGSQVPLGQQGSLVGSLIQPLPPSLVLPPPIKPRQVIVSSPGSPSSSGSAESQSASGSDSTKHHSIHNNNSHSLTSAIGRVSSPAIRASPSSSSSLMRSSPSISTVIMMPTGSNGISVTSMVGGARNSPLTISSLSRVSPSVLGGSPSSRSSSPAMQGSSAGLAVTLSSVVSTPSQSYTSSYSSYSNSYSTSMIQPPAYASTNPFLTGAYMTYTPPSSSTDMSYTDKYAGTSTSSVIDHYTDKYSSTNGNGNKDKPFLFSDSYDIPTKYSSALSYTKPNYDDTIYTSSAQVSASYKSPYISSTIGYGSDLKFNGKPSMGTYDTSSNIAVGGASGQAASSGLLGVEETPTPTSSIETEDSITREVGEKDVEGDGELSD